MLYAYTFQMTGSQIVDDLARMPGLGAVLYPMNYDLAGGHLRNRPCIAYCETPREARLARQYPFVGFIAGRNAPNVDANGAIKPSGPYLAPERAFDAFAAIRAELRGYHDGWVVPGALVPRGGFWSALFHRGRFDDAYHRERGITAVHWEASGVSSAEVDRVRREYQGVQLLSVAPGRGQRARLLEPSIASYARRAKADDVTFDGKAVRIGNQRVTFQAGKTHVAFWSLRATAGTAIEGGLFDASGSMTRDGEAVRAAMRAQV